MMNEDNKIDVNDIPDSVLLKYCIRDLKSARVEIGKLKSYIEELHHENNKLKNNTASRRVKLEMSGMNKIERREALIAFYKENGLDKESYKIAESDKKLFCEIEGLKNTRDDLILKIKQLNEKYGE